MATFVRYNSGDIVLSTDKIHSNAWTDSLNDLTTVFTASGGEDGGSLVSSPSSSGQFFFNIFKTRAAAESTTGSVEFSLAYGHKKGSGSKDFSPGVGGSGFSATKSVYNQYRQLVFGDETQEFTFNGVTPDDIYVINLERARIKQGLKPGSLNLTLASGSHVAAHPRTKIFLTDDSVTTTGSATLTNLGRQFNLVSGSSGTMLGSTLAQTDSGSYGFVYPDAGVIIMNPLALQTRIGSASTSTFAQSSGTNNEFEITPSQSSNADGHNIRKLYNAISGSFIVDAEEKVSSQFYFTRITNQEFNYSTNPSFTDNDGTLKFDSMANNPKVYITTVGLYNDANELLAVAKLSQPLAKDFTKEALIRIKLDY